MAQLVYVESTNQNQTTTSTYQTYADHLPFWNKLPESIKLLPVFAALNTTIGSDRE